MESIKLFVFLCGCLCMVQADLLARPINIAVLADYTVTLSCSVNTPNSRVIWREYASNTGGQTVSDGKLVNPSHPESARYSVLGAANEFHLEIRDVKLTDGGLYFCEDVIGPPATSRAYAELIVLETEPQCTDNVPVDGVVFEDFMYSAECEVRFSGALRPVMEWSGPGVFTSNSSNPATSVWSIARFTANRAQEGGRFSCITNFPPVFGVPPDYANNNPDYQHIYTGAPLFLLWGPNGIKITPIQGSYQEGDVLTCDADCKPDCEYEWTNQRTLEKLRGETFTVTSDLVGFDQTLRCQANMTFGNILQTADVFVSLSVPGTTTPTTPGSTTPTTPPPADAPCLDLTGRWGSINPDATVCLEVDAKGNMLTLIRNGSDLFFVTGTGKTVVNDYKHLGFTGVWPLQEAVGGFVGECHRCSGTEVIFLSGLYRNKRNSPSCGVSAGTQVTQYFVLTRNGPPCRGETLEVYDTNPGQLEKMGVTAKGEIFKPK